jgi:hypothetical protein
MLTFARKSRDSENLAIRPRGISNPPVVRSNRTGCALRDKRLRRVHVLNALLAQRNLHTSTGLIGGVL